MNKQLYAPIDSADFELPIKQGSRPRLHSTELFGKAREIVIEHAGEEYRLRLTRQGKLILTK